LGDARDRDVQIDWLCGVLSQLTAKECFPGISRLLVQLELDRHRLQPKVVRAVDRLESKDILDEMRHQAKRILKKLESDSGDVSWGAACHRIRRQILQQLDELLEHQDSLERPDDQLQHHAMRIAAKRLRYTMEIMRPIYPESFDEAIDVIKRVQSLLGDIHDCDVWIEHLDVFLTAENKRLTAIFGHPGRLSRLGPGIEYLRRDRIEFRQAIFRQLVALWTELSQRKFWEGLAGVVLSSSTKQPMMISEIGESGNRS
jgi:CHAD domain-containing protein